MTSDPDDFESDMTGRPWVNGENVDDMLAHEDMYLLGGDNPHGASAGFDPPSVTGDDYEDAWDWMDMQQSGVDNAPGWAGRWWGY